MNKEDNYQSLTVNAARNYGLIGDEPSTSHDHSTYQKWNECEITKRNKEDNMACALLNNREAKVTIY